MNSKNSTVMGAKTGQLQRERSALARKAAVIGMLLGLAYLLRALFPNLIMTGYDMPAHTMASLRLHLTAPFALDSWLNNTLAQAILYNHGYTTILLPWGLYEIAFSLLRLPVTEANLVYLHSLLGILSLASIFWFVSLHIDFRRTVAITALIAAAPIHIGLSRVHVGTQIIASIFFFTCLSVLHRYLKSEEEHERRKWQYLYYLAVFFYIGSENIFPVGLALQALYAVLMGTEHPRQEGFSLLRRLYLHPMAVLSIGLPVGVYAAAAAGALYYDLDGGYLLRLISKRSGLSINPLRPLIWMVDLFSPVFAFGLLMLPLRIHTHPVSINWANHGSEQTNRFSQFLVIMFSVYYIFLSISGSVEDNYVYTLLVPVMVAAGLWLARNRVLYAAGLLAMLIYTTLVVYNPNLPLPIRIKKNYGSVTSWTPSSDHAIKTTGYLYREGALNISTFQRGPVTWAGFFSEHQQAFYYFGAQTPRWIERDIRDGALGAFDRYLIADSLDSQDEDTRILREVIREQHLQRVGAVKDGEKELIVLYASQPAREIFNLNRLSAAEYALDASGNPVFEVNLLNKRFDQKYATIDRLPKKYLGQWGFLFPGRANDSPVASK